MHTILDPLKRARATAPDRIAVVDGSTRHTYAEYWSRCCRLAGALRIAGMQPGDRIAILAANGGPYLETYVAVPAAGMVVVPLNTRHAEPELQYALEDSGTRILLCDREPGKLADAVERVVRVPDEYEELLATADEAELGAGVEEETLAGLFYTGGTTGASKGVMLTHRNLIANTFHWMASLPYTDDDVYMIMAPMFHAAGSNPVLANIWNGITQVLVPVFDPGAALDIIEREKVTGTLGVPTMLAAMAEEQLVKPRDTSSLRAFTHGGSPIATELLRRARSAMPSAELVEVYGATETSPLATLLRHEEGLFESDRARSCGQSVLGVEIKILSEDEKPLPTGEVGEVVISGPNVMRGYWNKPEQSASVLRESGYWSGDLGYMDDEGYVFLVDRSKDMIVSGGENVYSTEVEEVLYRHERVLEAAVFGVPDEKWGEAVWAVVVPRDGTELSAEELIEFCRQHIGGYKVPKGVSFQSEPLPKSGPGKVLKRELRAPFWEGRDRSVN